MVRKLTDEEEEDLMLKILKKEITICETCYSFFEYKKKKIFCDECLKVHRKKEAS